jgi:putative acetyltransferase
LAPLAVLPDYQRQGIGTALIRHGLDACRDLGHDAVFVLGHREYYPKFGFSPELAARLDCAYACENFMALELRQGALKGLTGRIEYAGPFSQL